MSGKWADSDRRSRLPSDWKRRVASIKARAAGRCERRLPDGSRCVNPGKDVDHIRRGDDHSVTNLQLLCTDCHTAKTTREAAAERRRYAARLKYPKEAHPGLIR
ncbi:HNH endonuclease signature motif containing protein [Streptomyces sp. SM12]|uniref:HNH endonuclease n=1 Tax=Streptomyces sp. SM12 TaxID=1071602 RepID=UPI000CD554AE